MGNKGAKAKKKNPIELTEVRFLMFDLFFHYYFNLCFYFKSGRNKSFIG